MSDARRSVLFLHVPKTAGVSIETLIRAAVPAERINPAHPAHIVEDTDWSRVEEFEYSFSHVPLYLRSVLPRPLLCFTFLRDPTDRAISAYNHMLRAPGSPMNETITTGRLSFVEALAHPDLAVWLCNVTTRLVGAEADLRPLLPDGRAMLAEHQRAWSKPADEATLARALDQLARLEFVGVTESLEVDLRALVRLLGIDWPADRQIPFENAAPSEHPWPELVAVRTPETERAMRTHSPYEFELYDVARARSAARRPVAI